MEFNIQKCKVMHIRHSNPGYKYLMDNQYLQEVSDEKDLGIMITHQVTHQVEASPKGGLAQPPKINSQNMTVHDPSVCVASVVFQVHS